MTDELEAAVERVTETARLTEQITRLAAWTVDPTTFPEPCVDDVQGLFHALAEANERASLLQTAVHERIAERDEAREAIAELGKAAKAYLEENAEIDRQIRYGRDPEEEMERFKTTARHFHNLLAAALNPQQEGSRDHGK